MAATALVILVPMSTFLSAIPLLLLFSPPIDPPLPAHCPGPRPLPSSAQSCHWLVPVSNPTSFEGCGQLRRVPAADQPVGRPGDLRGARIDGQVHGFLEVGSRIKACRR